MKTYDPSRPGERERFMRKELDALVRFASAGEDAGAKVLSMSATYVCECGTVLRSWRDCWEHCVGHSPRQVTLL